MKPGMSTRSVVPLPNPARDVDIAALSVACYWHSHLILQ
jgi:hypothetical protein